MLVEITLEDDRWTRLEALAQKSLVTIVDHAKLNDVSISVLGCGDARIATLNADFRGKPQPTNVLSWPSANVQPGETPSDRELGDIAIAYETCEAEAEAQGKRFDDHVTHLLIHAVLHLLGYDHQTDAQSAQMESLEIALLAKLGIDNPYIEAGA